MNVHLEIVFEYRNNLVIAIQVNNMSGYCYNMLCDLAIAL